VISLKIFGAATLLRWAYVAAMYNAMGERGILGPDSYGYLALAQQQSRMLLASSISGWSWMGSDLSVMPIPLWLWTLCVLAVGDHGALACVLLHGLIDAATCVIIAHLAGTFDRRFALASGFAASLNPTQIVTSGLLYTDTIFLFFAALFLLGCVRWLRHPDIGWAVVAGLSAGAAALSRVVIVPFAIFALLFLAAAALWDWRSLPDRLRQLLVSGCLFGLCLAPILGRNAMQYGYFALTPQTGGHTALWVVPLVKEAKYGTRWQQGVGEIEARVRREFPQETDNPFEQSRRYSQVARAALIELGPAAIAKAWLLGAAINLGAPAAILMPPVMNLPRTGFYSTPGGTMLEKVANFVFQSENALYADILLFGIAGVAVFRGAQMYGLLVLLRQRETIVCLLFLLAWVGFILLVNGPVASPKYRLPIEPSFMVLTGAGLYGLRYRWRRAQPDAMPSKSHP